MVVAYIHFPNTDISWPVQNVVNMCIAITVSRVLQINELKWVLVALAGVTLYDFLGVVGSQQLTDGGSSIMEAVARAKSGNPNCNPKLSQLNPDIVTQNCHN